MKTRILSMLLAICMILTIVPLSVSAAPAENNTAAVAADDLVGLKDAYAGKFRMGVAISANEMRKTEVKDLTLKHYNSVTCENEMKPDSTLDQAACQNLGNNVETQVRLSDGARSIMKFCEDNHIPMRGHVIAWYSQTPGWFFREGFTNNGAYVTPEIMNQRLESFIRNLFALIKQDYPNLEIYAWDVVNEAFTDSNPATMRPASQSGWISVYGDNTFIYKAFEYAKKYAPEGCMLCYNDYNEYDTGKLNAIYDLTKDLYEKGLLDAIGMQSHLTVGNPTIDKYRAALEKYASVGCPVMITELDIQMRNGNEEEQVEYYRQFFEMLDEFHESIEAVVFWGTTDEVSWRPYGNPLPFSNYQPKPVYYAILDAVSDHEHVFAETVIPPTCTEDGYTSKVCTHEGCNRTVKSDPTAALGHKWDEGVVTLAPTETTTGLMTYTCERGCGATRTRRIPRLGATCPDSIDFTDPASVERFEIVNQGGTSIREGQGLYMVSTKDAVEPCNGQLSGTAATTPKDLVLIPVEGDWIATMKFRFDQNGSQGWYEFFGFYAMDDYNNMAGIRGGDGAIQDFLRKNGNLTADTNGVKTSAGLKSASTHWFRIEKAGDSYTCYWSTDGENFAEIFGYENTGINGEYIMIDAYSGMATGYTYTVEYLDFEEGAVPPAPAELAIVTEPASFAGKIGETATFAVEANRSDVTYQWMYSKNGGKTWSVSAMPGCDRASMDVQMKAARVGQMYKVVVTDSEGNSVESAVVTLATASELKIVANPADSTVAVGKTAAFTVKAEGEGLTYQWMYSNNGGASWSKSSMAGFGTDTISVAAKAFRNGQQYKCVVTDASGNVVESTAAILNIG